MRQYDPLVDRRMAFDQLARALFDGPGQEGMGEMLAQCAGDRHGVDHVADRVRRTKRMRGGSSSADIAPNYRASGDVAKERNASRSLLPKRDYRAPNRVENLELREGAGHNILRAA